MGVGVGGVEGVGGVGGVVGVGDVAGVGGVDRELAEKILTSDAAELS